MKSRRHDPEPGSTAGLALPGGNQGQRPGPKPSPREPLGRWSWIGNIWISAGLGGGAFGLISAPLMPLNDVGRLDLTTVVVAAAAVGLLVFVAGLHVIGDLIRKYRQVGTALFWLPAILGTTVLNSGLLILARLAIASMGMDFLPLALPLAGLTGSGLALLSLWSIWRFWKSSAPIEERPGLRPLMTLLLAAFSTLFFTIGSEVMLGWGSGPSLVVGLLVTALLARLFLEREIGWWFAPVVALPLALLAAEMPPSGLAALTVLVLSLTAGILAKLGTGMIGARRSTFFSSLSAAALALMLVIAPTAPAPALWGAEKLGHPLQPLGDAVMRFYTRLYETEYGHAWIAAIGGFRSGAASTHAVDVSFDAANRRYTLMLEVTNTGERGIRHLVFLLPYTADELAYGCGPVALHHRLEKPLWPGDRVELKVNGAMPDGCTPEEAQELTERIAANIRATGGSRRVDTRILETQMVNPTERFQEDARTWLGLQR